MSLYPDITQNDLVKGTLLERYAHLHSMLTECMTEFDALDHYDGLSEQTLQWWTNIKKSSAAKQKLNAEANKRAEEKQRALAKLTRREKELLGL